jgi:hypothetical protein
MAPTHTSRSPEVPFLKPTCVACMHYVDILAKAAMGYPEFLIVLAVLLA